MEGTLILRLPNTTEEPLELACDLIPTISDSVSTSITRVPIVTFKAEQAFAFDVGTSREFTVNITRIDPHEENANGDSSLNPAKWSNGKFEKRLTEYINRWQAETDGCHLVFTPFTTGQAEIRANVYLSNLTVKSEKGIPDAIYFTLTAVVGTMTAKVVPVLAGESWLSPRGYFEKVYFKDSFVTLSSSDGTAHYFIYFGGADVQNCLSSYTAICGPSQPFPSVVLNISKKNLSAVAPMLVDDIIPGKNRVYIRGVGQGDYIVTKVSSSGQNYKVTAYSIYEQYRSSPLPETIVFGRSSGAQFKTPMEAITRILTDKEKYGVPGAKIFFGTDDIIFCYLRDNDTWSTDSSTFVENTDAWYVLSVCALRLGCKIWFANGKAYVVDLSIKTINANVACSENFSFNDIASLSLNLEEYYPQDPSEFDIQFSKSVCGDTLLGSEGAETLKNYSEISYNNGNTTAVADDTEMTIPSRDKYGFKKHSIVIREINQDGLGDAKKITANIVDRYCDAEQSIGFVLMETHYDTYDDGTNQRLNKYWQPFFSLLTRVGTIRDYSKDIVVSNKTNFMINGAYATMYNKLALSSAEYHFPEGCTEYWFGVMEPTNLTQNTSVINNIVYNG